MWTIFEDLDEGLKFIVAKKVKNMIPITLL